jgi:D-erythrulose 1-phosphate 3-epimerase
VSWVLGINNCFAVKRWPLADEWAGVVRDELGLSVVQHSLDLVDFTASHDELLEQAESVRSACAATGLTPHSVFTGLAAYSAPLLLGPDPGERRRALAWYERVLEFAAACGATVAGGHLGSLSAADFALPERREELWGDLERALDHLRHAAGRNGIETLLVENMACAREPSTRQQVRRLLSDADADRAAVALCLDIGHQVVPGTSDEERDPYAWLRALGSRSAVVHLQQSDSEGDHHWPFTARYNALGRIEPDRVLSALGDARPALIIEVIPPFEAADAQVLAELRETAEYWRAALERAG